MRIAEVQRCWNAKVWTCLSTKVLKCKYAELQKASHASAFMLKCYNAIMFTFGNAKVVVMKWTVLKYRSARVLQDAYVEAHKCHHVNVVSMLK